MRKDYDIEDAFAAIEDELIDSMIRNMKRHRLEEDAEEKQWEMWQALQLKALEEYKKKNQTKFTSWFSNINKRIEEVIKEANGSGYMDQELEILDAIKKGFKGYKKSSSTMQAEFFRLNERKLEALIKSTTDDMKKAEVAILRMANDQYRKTIFNAQVYANTGAGTYEKAIDMATRDMLYAGLNCVEYANGARHTLKDYADMALRTASKRAYLQGEGTKRQEWGISTVIVNKRGNPCPKCLPFCGKILIDDVWSGGTREDGSYPLMSKAIAAGLYHPRCKDSHTTYFEGISTTPDGKYTRREIEKIVEDYRREQKQQYAKRQAEKFERLEKYSLDSQNQSQYSAKSIEWKNKLDTNEFIYENTPVYYNELNDYSIKIDGYNEVVNEGISKALEDVAKKGSVDRYEHMYLVDLETGELVYYETNGEASSVGLDFWNVVKNNPTRKYAFIHNHNIISSLSEADLMTPVTTPNIPIIFAVQNDGAIYYARKIKDVPKKFWQDDYFKDELKALNEAVRNGIIMPSERSSKREQIIIKCLLNEFYEGMVIIDAKRK